MRSTQRLTGRHSGCNAQDSYIIRESLFLQAYPFARRAAQVRSAGAISRHAGLDRDDLEQDVLVGLWRALAQFDPTRASLRTYVERVVATSIITTLRRSTAKKRKLSDDTLLPEPLSMLVRIEYRIDIERALTTLNKRDKTIARLLADYRISEVAQMLRISRQAVYRSMGRIRTALSIAGLGQFRY